MKVAPGKNRGNEAEIIKPMAKFGDNSDFLSYSRSTV